jgi:hypothetical protein
MGLGLEEWENYAGQVMGHDEDDGMASGVV